MLWRQPRRARLQERCLDVLQFAISTAIFLGAAEEKAAFVKQLATLKYLRERAGAAETLFDVVTDDDGLLDNRVAAAACLQILLSDPAWVFVLAQEQDLLDDLELLVGDENFCADAQLAHYLLGALANAAQAAATTTTTTMTTTTIAARSDSWSAR
mgnify:CR=1 FL=1